ncbi:hypothetical protein PV721_06270 [Streptomyces sp. MB09-01]|uniref:hypothetical protein n=1 Tax=Streptomyces sp. MB09-01 TaxID=3028666 RepID=UPI0029BE1CE5|nr:hypothetical protein [Streptomyces sp. MB09-01]MDX3533978.1 hypothetical protein [Streptomyces sp. MB09-01]
MRWTQAFDEAMGELRGARKQLERIDDPTVGLPALHGELSQARMKIQEVVQNGVTGLREENRELRRRQDKMIADLQESREETREAIQQLRELADLLRGFATAPTAAPQQSGPPQPGAVEAGQNFDEDITEPPTWQTTREREDQGENMKHTQGPDLRKATGNEVAEDGLKAAIEAAYRGTGTRTAPAPTASEQTPGSQPEDPKVAHGVLLLKAAGVASAELVLHRDTWEFLSALAVDHGHFRTPPAVEDVKEGRIQAALSGRSLIAVLIELWNTRTTATALEADWALATTAYNRIAAELAGATGSGETIRITLDDGLGHTGIDED